MWAVSTINDPVHAPGPCRLAGKESMASKAANCTYVVVAAVPGIDPAMPSIHSIPCSRPKKSFSFLLGQHTLDAARNHFPVPCQPQRAALPSIPSSRPCEPPRWLHWPLVPELIVTWKMHPSSACPFVPAARG